MPELGSMNNNDKISKLEREIWLFQQWSQDMQGQEGATQQRILKAYQECIEARQQELDALQNEEPPLLVVEAEAR